YVANSDDCYDDNSLTRPGQGGRFSEHRGDGSFDYDCDGQAELAYPKLAKCPMFSEADHACPPPNQWPEGYSVASCVDDPDHPKCYCDYLELTDRIAEGRDGWVPTKPIPECGQLGFWGFTLEWRDGQWSCSYSQHTASQRRQICR